MVRTYRIEERANHPHFGIRDQTTFAHLPVHQHEFFEIQFNLQGTTSHQYRDKVLPVVPGTMSFIAPYTPHRIEHPPRTRCYVIYFDISFLRPGLSLDPLDIGPADALAAPELLPFLHQEDIDFVLDGEGIDRAADYCERMMRENQTRGFFALEVLRALLLQTIALACRKFEGALRERLQAGAPVPPPSALARARRYLRENALAGGTLTQAAQAAGVSPSRLAHLIKLHTGRTFTELVQIRRMDHASQLLVQTSLRVSQVAEMAGFSDAGYFTRQFKQRFGRSPQRYRELMHTMGRNFVPENSESVHG